MKDQIERRQQGKSWRTIVSMALIATSFASPILSSAQPAQVKALPALLQLARTQPDTMVSVVVQKLDRSHAIDGLVSRLGGRITMSLDIINAIAAELPAGAIVTLASAPGVRWVSPDGDMESSSDIGQGDQPGFQVPIDSGSSAKPVDTVGTMPLQQRVTPQTPGADAGIMQADGSIVPTTPLTDDGAIPVSVNGDAKRHSNTYWPIWIDPNMLRNKYQYVVNAWGAWLGGYTGNDVGVAVVDSGMTSTFEDFKDHGAYDRITASVAFQQKDALNFACSFGNDSMVNITFANYSGRTVDVYWRDGNCIEVLHRTLSNGQKYTQKSSPNHNWVIRDASTNAPIFTHLAKSKTQVNIPAPAPTSDGYGHGTHVGAIIGGKGRSSDSNGYAGAAPNVDLITVRVTKDDGSAKVSNVVAGLQWVLENKARYNIRVVNLSMNSSSYESYNTNPLCAAAEVLWFNGIVVVVSAGNRGGGNLFPPANDPFVITVGATDDRDTWTRTDDTLAPFSAYGVVDGVSKPDLVAPGRHIKAPMPFGVLAQKGPAVWVEGDIYRMSGTLMSSPIVAAAAAMLLEKEPGLTPDQVKYRLMSTAQPFLTSAVAGAGLLNINSALHTSTSASANTGRPMSKLLTGGNTTAWNSVSWSSVGWSSVSWSSVSWSSVSWSSDYREP